MHALRLKKRLQAGISLLEVMLSLSIISIILVMATRYFDVASNMEHINEMRTDLGGLVVAAENWVHYHNGYAGVSINALYTNELLPPGSYIQQNTGGVWEMRNPWGNPVTIVPSSIGAGSNNAYTITTALRSDAQCERLRTIYPDMATSGYGTQCAAGIFTMVGPIA